MFERLARLELTLTMKVTLRTPLGAVAPDQLQVTVIVRVPSDGSRWAFVQVTCWRALAEQSKPEVPALTPVTMRLPGTRSVTLTVSASDEPLLETAIVKVWPVVPAMTASSAKV